MKRLAVMALLGAAFLAGCSGGAQKLGVTGDEAREVIASVARERGASFSLTEQGRPKRSANEMAEWLLKHPQPPMPDKKDHPAESASCKDDPNPTRFISYIPTPVKMAAAATNSRPWAFVRYDIDDQGNTLNLRPLKNSGFKEFADASLITVALWKYTGQPQAFGLKGCIGIVNAQ